MGPTRVLMSLTLKQVGLRVCVLKSRSLEVRWSTTAHTPSQNQINSLSIHPWLSRASFRSGTGGIGEDRSPAQTGRPPLPRLPAQRQHCRPPSPLPGHKEWAERAPWAGTPPAVSHRCPGTGLPARSQGPGAAEEARDTGRPAAGEGPGKQPQPPQSWTRGRQAIAREICKLITALGNLGGDTTQAASCSAEIREFPGSCLPLGTAGRAGRSSRNVRKMPGLARCWGALAPLRLPHSRGDLGVGGLMPSWDPSHLFCPFLQARPPSHWLWGLGFSVPQFPHLQMGLWVGTTSRILPGFLPSCVQTNRWRLWRIHRVPSTSLWSWAPALAQAPSFQ